MWSYLKQALSLDSRSDLLGLLDQIEAREHAAEDEDPDEPGSGNKLVSVLIEAERLRNERLRIRLSFLRFVLGTLILGSFSLGISWQVQMFQLTQEREKREADYIAQFTQEALDVDLPKRIRFAHYFTSLAPSEDVRQRWNKYYGELKTQALSVSGQLETLKAERDKYKNKKTLTPEEQEELKIIELDIAQLEQDEPKEFLQVWSEEELNLPITNGVSFTWADATHGGTRVPQSKEVRENIISLAKELQKAQDQLNAPISIHSWYRPEPINTQVGGSKNSLHTTGNAVNIAVAGYTTQQLMEELSWWPGGMYPAFSNDPNLALHLDVRGVRVRESPGWD